MKISYPLAKINLEFEEGLLSLDMDKLSNDIKIYKQFNKIYDTGNASKKIVELIDKKTSKVNRYKLQAC